MQVFKAYFKVMRGSAVSLTISLSVFVGLAVLFSLIAPKTPMSDFEPTRTPVAVINRDGDCELAQGLVDYLAYTSQPVPYPDDEEKLQDALFIVRWSTLLSFHPVFRCVHVREDCAIRKVVVPDSTSSHYVDMSIDNSLTR